MPYVKNHIRVTVPHHSGFDKSHRNTGSLTCGTITPILCDEVIPGTRVHLRIPIAVQLPPLASDTYMNLKLRAEAFFVPLRLLVGSFESWFSDFGEPGLVSGANSEDALAFAYKNDVKGVLPSLAITSEAHSFVGPGSLLDYLGFKMLDSIGAENYPVINPMPLLAYHLVYHHWYRNPRVQRPVFMPFRAAGTDTSFDAGSVVGSKFPICSAPFTFYSSRDTASYVAQETTLEQVGSEQLEAGSLILGDGINLLELRQRNFGLDYFTGARPSAQLGDVSSVSIPVVSNTGTMTIAQLRAANSLQQFRERNNLPSPRMVDQVKARYGANLSDGVAQRPICIGSASYDVSSTGVSQTGGASSSANPFSSVAAQYGRAYASGSDIIIDDFTANEPGYILVNVTLVPEATYSTGIDRMFRRYLKDGSIVEMATPLLQNMGDQAVKMFEIAGKFDSEADDIFAYQDRFADFMFKMNSVHGKLAEGEDLSSFVLQRTFLNYPSYGSEFLQIPKNFLDGVFAISAEVSGLSAWYDAMLQYKVSMPLAEFSIPSLQDPAYEHGKSVSLRRNGQIF